MAVDSGASATVVSDEMVKAVSAQNARPDVKYEVADGSQIPHLGEKKFSAETECGLPRKMDVQVTEVNRALLSLPKIVNSSNRVVFDSEGSYIEHCETGERSPLEESNGTFAMRLWGHKDQKSPFAGQVQ